MVDRDLATNNVLAQSMEELSTPNSRQWRSPTYSVKQFKGHPSFWTPLLCCYCETYKKQELIAEQMENINQVLVDL